MLKVKQAGIGLFFKRFFDYLFALVLLILSSIFLLIAMLIVKIASPRGSVFFKQERVGRKGKIFKVYKLRTMTNDKDEHGNFLPDEMRLKKWGKFLRRTNLDEIPQIFNVIKNDMSLIGPRPLLPKEMVIMSEEEQKKRQSVFPGITGWEAVNEGKSSNRREMALLDLEYVDKWSFGLDIKIFFKTIGIIFGNKRPDDSVRAPKIEQELKENQSGDLSSESADETVSLPLEPEGAVQDEIAPDEKQEESIQDDIIQDNEVQNDSTKFKQDAEVQDAEVWDEISDEVCDKDTLDVSARAEEADNRCDESLAEVVGRDDKSTVTK